MQSTSQHMLAARLAHNLASLGRELDGAYSDPNNPSISFAPTTGGRHVPRSQM